MAKKITSKKVASKASSLFRSKKATPKTKSVAASVLSQREKKVNKKK